MNKGNEWSQANLGKSTPKLIAMLILIVFYGCFGAAKGYAEWQTKQVVPKTFDNMYLADPRHYFDIDKQQPYLGKENAYIINTDNLSQSATINKFSDQNYYIIEDVPDKPVKNLNQNQWQAPVQNSANPWQVTPNTRPWGAPHNNQFNTNNQYITKQHQSQPFNQTNNVNQYGQFNQEMGGSFSNRPWGRIDSQNNDHSQTYTPPQDYGFHNQGPNNRQNYYQPYDPGRQQYNMNPTNPSNNFESVPSNIPNYPY